MSAVLLLGPKILLDHALTISMKSTAQIAPSQMARIFRSGTEASNTSLMAAAARASIGLLIVQPVSFKLPNSSSGMAMRTSTNSCAWHAVDKAVALSCLKRHFCLVICCCGNLRCHHLSFQTVVHLLLACVCSDLLYERSAEVVVLYFEAFAFGLFGWFHVSCKSHVSPASQNSHCSLSCSSWI